VAGKPARGELPPNPERIFALSLPDATADPMAEANLFRPPFAHLALLLQVPGPDIMQRLEVEKGAPLSDAEKDIALERIAAAQAWLADFAPDSARFAIQYDRLPAAATDLAPEQKTYLGRLSDAAQSTEPAGGETWQALIFDTARAMDLKPGEAFAALYRVILDRPNGPRAGWLLASLSSAFVIGRLREAAGGER
jgi:lysyl-tRNA synthetase class 1